MLLYDIISLCLDNTIINIYDLKTHKLLFCYNETNEIDTELFSCEIAFITSENTNGIAIYIKMGVVKYGTF